MRDLSNVSLIGSNNVSQVGLRVMKEGDVMFWDSFIQPIFGYIALIVVLGAVLVILYVLVIATFLIRKLIAPEYEIPKVSLEVHKNILIGIGIVFLTGLVLFAFAFTPAILGLVVLYLFFKYVFPMIWKKILA